MAEVEYRSVSLEECSLQQHTGKDSGSAIHRVVLVGNAPPLYYYTPHAF